ncbi:MAG: ABC transporter ATP-binding protein [Verrucomicrobiales bacterium]
MKEGERAAIVMEALSVRVGSKVLLSGIDLCFRDGEHVALIGPNGAGKTTLLKCILRLMSFESGRLLLNGRSVRDYRRRDLAKQVACVPQQLPEGVGYTVREFVEMGCYAFKRSAFDVDGLLKQCELREFRDRVVGSLSGGERQRVSIAAAIAQDCPILLLDEPCSYLDPRQSEQVQDLITRVGMGRTVVVVTHDLNWAGSFDRVVGMAGGVCVFDGSRESFGDPEDLSALYQTSFLTVPHPLTGRPVIVRSGKEKGDE